MMCPLGATTHNVMMRARGECPGCGHCKHLSEPGRPGCALLCQVDDLRDRIDELEKLVRDIWEQADPEAWPQEWRDRVASVLGDANTGEGRG